MLKVKFLVAYFLFAFTNLFGFDNIPVLKIEYQVFVEQTDKLEFYKYELPFEEVHYVSQSRVVTLKKYNENLESKMRIYDLDLKQSFECFVDNKGTKIAASEPFIEKVRFEDKTIGSKKYQIAGMLCEKFEVQQGGKVLEMFTTNYFGIDFCPFSLSKGYALQYSYLDETYGVITYLATNVTPIRIDESLFSLNEYDIKDGVFENELLSNWEEEKVKKESETLYNLYSKQLKYKLPLFDGSDIQSNEQLGKLTILNFKGNLSEEEIERDFFENIQSKHADQKLDVFYVLSEFQHLNQLKKKASNIKNVYYKKALPQKFKVEYLPTVVLLDKDGKVIFYNVGYDTESLAKLDKLIGKQ